MAKPIKFNQVSGLTAYAFGRGYIQIAKLQRGGAELSVWLGMRHGAYVVQVDDSSAGMLHHTVTTSLLQARKVWLEQAESRFAEPLAAVKRDKRFSFVREFGGEREQQWVTRFCGEWVGKSYTKVGAQLLAYSHTHGYRA